MNPDFKKYLLKVTVASSCVEVEVIQSLWSGYGKISRYQLEGASLKTVVVKNISLDSSNGHPRGWSTDIGHNRKVKSYRVETHWYEKWSHRCSNNCKVPQYIGSYSEGQEQWIIIEDLNIDFPVRKQHLNIEEIKVCLKWLANFHATFLNQKPDGLWEVGTYWNLETRPEEFEKMEHLDLKQKAHLIDELLNQCKYQTIVHGDAKLANFCFSENAKEVAGVDFQYVGGGCGMKDVAYFLGSCLSGAECELHEEELLGFYFSELQKAMESVSFNIDFQELKIEWIKMYPVACADFTRFLLGWMPSHEKINDYQLNLLQAVLLDL